MQCILAISMNLDSNAYMRRNPQLSAISPQAKTPLECGFPQIRKIRSPRGLSFFSLQLGRLSAPSPQIRTLSAANPQAETPLEWAFPQIRIIRSRGK